MPILIFGSKLNTQHGSHDEDNQGSISQILTGISGLKYGRQVVTVVASI